MSNTEFNSSSVVKGYKVFTPDWMCRGKQYTCPGKFEEDITPRVCRKGMHFCEKLTDCFSYYDFNPANHVAEVIAYGAISREGAKCATDKLEVIREIPWVEVLEMVNSGNWNSGYSNSGNWNTGNRNLGNRNSGNGNTGYWNSGNHNSGDGNSGCYNSGNWNTGNHNTGNWNTGSRNTGDGNTGDRNSGDRNSGDWNTGSRNTGCFNTVTPTITLFNRPSDWTIEDWTTSEARKLMTQFEEVMEQTEGEGEAQLWWQSLAQCEKKAILSIPNFDADIFKEITGIDVRE